MTDSSADGKGLRTRGAGRGAAALICAAALVGGPVGLAGGWAVAAPGPSPQAVGVPSRAAVVQAISDCRKVADPTARLDCYDKAADSFDQAQAQGQVVVIDRAQAREVRRQAFGFNIPSINLFAHGPKEEAITHVTVELAQARKGLDGKWLMTTTEGAVWRQIDDQDLFNDPHAGSKMAIRNAMMGSFFCNVDGQSAIRCTRER